MKQRLSDGEGTARSSSLQPLWKAIIKDMAFFFELQRTDIKKHKEAKTSDVVETLMVETKTETWKKFETKTRDQDLKKFSRPRLRLGEFFETETRLRDPRF